MQIHVSPVCSAPVQLRHLTPFVMTQLGGSLGSNGSHLHCQLIEAECRWVTMLPCLLIISYMYLKAQFSAFSPQYVCFYLWVKPNHLSKLATLRLIMWPAHSNPEGGELDCARVLNSACSNKYYNLMQRAGALWHGWINLFRSKTLTMDPYYTFHPPPSSYQEQHTSHCTVQCSCAGTMRPFCVWSSLW